MAEIISVFLTAGYGIWEHPDTVCQGFTSYRVKANNSLGFTDHYAHPGEVNNCQRCASSSCPALKVLQEFAAVSPEHSSPDAWYTLWIPFVFPLGLQSRKVGRRVRKSLLDHSCSSQLLGVRLHGQKCRSFLFRHTSVFHMQLKNSCPTNKENAGIFCLFIADNSVWVSKCIHWKYSILSLK